MSSKANPHGIGAGWFYLTVALSFIFSIGTVESLRLDRGFDAWQSNIVFIVPIFATQPSHPAFAIASFPLCRFFRCEAYLISIFLRPEGYGSDGSMFISFLATSYLDWDTSAEEFPSHCIAGF